MLQADFDTSALYDAMDELRGERKLTWAQVTREVNACHVNIPGFSPVATATITAVKDKKSGNNANTILCMLSWLERPPESFVPGLEFDQDACQLPRIGKNQILRWNTKAIYRALDEKRAAHDLTWKATAAKAGVANAAALTRLNKGPIISIANAMHIVAWLEAPAVTYIIRAEWDGAWKLAG